MTDKEIKRLAEQKIKEGKSRQETFDELQSVSSTPSTGLADIVKFFPSLELRKQYKIQQVVLVLLLVYSVIIKMISTLPLIVEKGVSWLPLILIIPAITIFFTYAVITFKTQYYKWIAFISIWGILKSYTALMDGETFMYFQLGVTLFTAGLSYFLYLKLASDYEIIKEPYRNNQGQNRLRKKIIFKN